MVYIVLLFFYCPLVTSNRKAVRSVFATNNLFVINSDMSTVDYIATSTDKLYYTNYDRHTVTCCDLHGTTQWDFKDNRARGYDKPSLEDNICL
jgi:hypothetical protein